MWCVACNRKRFLAQGGVAEKLKNATFNVKLAFLGHSPISIL